MVLILLRLRAALLRNTRSRRALIGQAAAAILAFISAIATLYLGFIRYATPEAGGDVVALITLSWMVGRVAFGALAGGDTTLRIEFFRLLPIPRRKLAWALMIVGLADPGLVILAVAFAAIPILGAHYSLVAALTGALAALLLLILTGFLTTVVSGLAPSPSHRKRDAGTFILAVTIAALSVTSTLIPGLIAALMRGALPTLATLLAILPPGWATGAAVAAARGDAVGAILDLAGLAVAILAVIGCSGRVLARRMDGRAGGGRAGRPRAIPIRARTPGGAVMAKELRLWARDPMRFTCLTLAALIGLGVCILPALVRGTTILLPFAGLLSAVIASGCAGNLLGFEGRAFFFAVTTPHSARPELRGRQAAWLAIVAPYLVAVTLLLTLVSRQDWAWPWVLALLPAILGGAAGLIPLASVVAVQPLDDAGAPSASFILKIYACLFLTLGTALPAAGLLLWGTLARSDAIRWLGVPTGAITGLAAAICFSRIAIRVLRAREIDILFRLTAR